MGDVKLQPVIHGQLSRPVVLSHVLYVPNLSHNLVSTTYLSKHHQYSIIMEGAIIAFYHSGQLVLEADINDMNTAYIRAATLPSLSSGLPISALPATTLPLSSDLWHRRLGHHSMTHVNKMVKHQLVTGFNIPSSAPAPDPICVPCLAC
jgi:hypothetical protein